ncbi:MAG: hypothetical protein ACRENU_10500 [Gemmatimonadaceae bacterium]
MKRSNLTIAAVALATALFQTPLAAQGHTHPTLHINPRWKECSFQLSSSLTQSEWRQFTEEAGLVVYFRPLSDARPMGRGNFEISMLQWKTGIDDHDDAWNDTFVHPDSVHWLFEGSGLEFPGLTVRAGVTAKTDIGVYVTKSPNANYGFYGAQVQRSLLETGAWAASARVSFVSLYGPEDLDFSVYGADLMASRTLTLSRRIALSPYVGVSSYLAGSHEKSTVVALEDQRVFGAHATAGAVMQLSKARLGLEYSVAKVPTLSMKIGFGRS